MNPKLRLLIVDDEPQARMGLRGMLAEPLFEDVELLGEATDLPQAVRQVQALQPQVLLLDIEMPRYSGLEILQFFNPEDLNFKIIFTTAYSEYALQAFELSAVDYLLKPIQPSLLRKALDKAKSLSHNTAQQLQTLSSHYTEGANPKIALQVADGLVMVQLDEILYLKADGSYTNIHLSEGRRLTVSKKLLEYEKLERYPQFIRVHRSHIVNMNKVRRYLKQDAGILLMEDQEQLPVAPDKKAKVLDWWKEMKI